MQVIRAHGLQTGQLWQQRFGNYMKTYSGLWKKNVADGNVLAIMWVAWHLRLWSQYVLLLGKQMFKPNRILQKETQKIWSRKSVYVERVIFYRNIYYLF